MSPSPTPEGLARGFVIPIGGAEERSGDMTVLTRFVVPTASNLADTGSRYEALFQQIGVAAVSTLPISERVDGANPDYLDQLEKADGVFITGGNQLRLSTILGGTEFAQKLRRVNASGTHIAGTSAGAAIMPEHMIAGGATGVLPHADGVRLVPGLGLTNALLIDQHFSQRDRLGRLLTALSYNPYLIGVGIDEDTALFIGPENSLEVEGSGSVTIIDPSELTYTSSSDAAKHDNLSLLNLRVHILSQGFRYDLNTRTPAVPV